jgi:hypothetical protein
MTSAEIWQWVGQALTLIGGVGVVAAAVAKYFADRSNESHKAELGRETERLKTELGKDVETHKWKLKKKEMLFQKEFQAALELFDLRRKIEPRFRHPNMEWHEAMEDVVERFSSSEKILRDFIAKHGPVLRPRIREDLDRCQQLAENNQYAQYEGTTREAEKAAEEFLKKLEDAERRFAIDIRRN